MEDQSFSAHRIVLAATIPYFYAMFCNDMAESRIKEITMKEIDPQYVFQLIVVKIKKYSLINYFFFSIL